MTDQIAYQEYIQRRYNAFCKTVIRCAALDKILKLKRQWERQVSLDYLMNEKFVQFAASEPDEEYPFTVCGQTVLLCNAALADAISVLPEQTREEILRYYFPAAARDRRVYWPVTQHSGAAYPACLAAATRRNGGEPV
jgi:DNA-directed RNA polymerase specialized sigma24 family protein